ncbi:MAG: cadmium-translocating P-type ATPase [Clostridia bacterium]|nr:cadmium-translocating P-type ATPase [Clostridia bacterium]
MNRKKLKKRLKRLYKSEPLRILVGLCFFIPALILEHLGFEAISLGLFIAALLLSGATVFISAFRGILRGDVFDEKLLMSVAAVGAMIIGEAEEGVAVMLFFLVGEWFEHIAVRRSRNSIRSLMDIRPDTATVLADGAESVLDAEDVAVGSVILIRSGERVPIDCAVISGECDLDNSALTGESLPISVKIGDELSSGAVVLGGAVTAKTLRTADSSAAARILDLVENAQERKSRAESFITRFSRVYTPIVFSLALLMAVLPPIFGWLDLTDSLYRALSFLVVSCPCALVISVPMAFFGGIGNAASHGILYKGGNVFAPLSNISEVVFDKTGTLTEGRLIVDKITPADCAPEKLLSLAASAEYASIHPIARALKSAATEIYPAEEITEFSGKGIIARVNGISVAVGNSYLMAQLGFSVPNADGVYVALDGKYAGSIGFADEIKAEAPAALERLRRLGVKRLSMLSGDRRENAERVGAALSLDEINAELLPDGKLSLLEKKIAENRGSVVYVGDGINDAPCLARADVGIAMGSLGADSAIEAADAVIMSDNLSRLPDAVKIARKTERIAKQNIVLAIGIKALVLLLVSLDISGMWMAVFADVGVAVLAILNSFRALIGKRK